MGPTLHATPGQAPDGAEQPPTLPGTPSQARAGPSGPDPATPC